MLVGAVVPPTVAVASGMRVQVVGWAVVAVGTVAFVLSWVLTQRTTCFDAVDPARSTCVTEPALGVDGSVLLGVIGLLVAGFAVFRAVRAARSRPDGTARSAPRA